MTKKQRIDFINDTFSRFDDAKNHGHSNNWWHPTANRIAYNVKMHSYADIDTLREVMTTLQNDYYSDDMLQQEIYDEQDQACEMLVEDIKEISLAEDTSLAGSSGGWLEVTYTVNFESVDDATDREDLLAYYREAKELEKQESIVADRIEKAHTSYNKYMDSKDYYADMVENMLSNDEIKSSYKEHAESLLAKIN